MAGKRSTIGLLRCLQGLARRIIVLARSRYAARWLYGLTALESIIFPLPTDPLLATMVAAKPRRWLSLAFWTTTSSVIGGVGGYVIGWLMVGPALEYFVDSINQGANYRIATDALLRDGALWIFVAGLSPLPYKIAAIGAGAVEVSLIVFISVSFVARGMRYFMVAAIMYWLGPLGRYWIQRKFNQLTVFVCVALVLLVAAAHALSVVH